MGSDRPNNDKIWQENWEKKKQSERSKNGEKSGNKGNKSDKNEQKAGEANVKVCCRCRN